MNMAPHVAVVSSHHRTPRGAVRLGDVRAGERFVPAHDTRCVFSLISHREVDVRDAARRWCVVVDRNETSDHVLGEIQSFCVDTQVYVLKLRQAALFEVA